MTKKNIMAEQAATRRVPVLEPPYTLRDRAEVLRFVQDHPFLVPLLLDASSPIQEHFPGAQSFLEVVTDPETANDRELVVSVATDLPPTEALVRLRALDRDWWLPSLDRAKGKLCITVEFR